MGSLKVWYFAQLKELSGVESETVTIGSEKTYADLYQSLSLRYRFPIPAEMIQVAVNDEFAGMDAELSPGAQVVFIPPVAGG